MSKNEFMIKAKRGRLANENYAFGVIQGLKMSICEDCDLSTSDCELFSEYCIFFTETTHDKFEKFKDTVNSIYPGLCEYYEKSKWETGVYYAHG